MSRRPMLHLFAALAVLLAPAAARAQRAENAFPIRGALPWHNFLSGPTAWDEADWEQYLDNMQRLKLNLLSLHCYTGGAQRYVNYVEPMIRIEYRGVVPEAALDTSLTARWGYRPLAVEDFAFGTGKLFSLPRGARAFGSRAAVLARTNEERYRAAQSLIGNVIRMAHERGIRVAMGFEFGVYPPELYSVVPEDAYFRANMLPDPTHASSMEILRRTIDDILRAYPGIDWVWLWLQEHETPAAKDLSKGMQALLDRDSALFKESTQPGTTFSGVWSLAYVRAAHQYLRERAPRVRVAISGWGGAEQLPGILGGLDRGLSRDIVFTCLNPGLGRGRQPDILASIAKNRDVWAIPWFEGDGALWHPQPRVTLMRDHVLLAREQRLAGVVAIHWRTEETRAAMDAFARFAANPEQAPTVEAFYAEDCRKQFGDAAGAAVAGLLTRMDHEAWFEQVSSPEYYPYNPRLGRLTPDLRVRIADAAAVVEGAAGKAEGTQRDNVRRLHAALRFTLLLDEVSKGIEPSYRLSEQWNLGQVDASRLSEEVRNCRAALAAVPIRELFETYASRVKSRGSLGVLSSLNQRLWLAYRDMDRFLAGLEQAGK